MASFGRGKSGDKIVSGGKESPLGGRTRAGRSQFNAGESQAKASKGGPSKTGAQSFASGRGTSKTSNKQSKPAAAPKASKVKLFSGKGDGRRAQGNPGGSAGRKASRGRRSK